MTVGDGERGGEEMGNPPIIAWGVRWGTGVQWGKIKKILIIPYPPHPHGNPHCPPTHLGGTMGKDKKKSPLFPTHPTLMGTHIIFPYRHQHCLMGVVWEKLM